MKVSGADEGFPTEPLNPYLTWALDLQLALGRVVRHERIWMGILKSLHANLQATLLLSG